MRPGFGNITCLRDADAETSAWRKERNGSTPRSDDGDHPRDRRRRRLCAVYCAHKSAADHRPDRHATDAHRDSCRANKSTANRRADRRAADTHRSAPCVAKPTPN